MNTLIKLSPIFWDGSLDMSWRYLGLLRGHVSPAILLPLFWTIFHVNWCLMPFKVLSQKPALLEFAMLWASCYTTQKTLADKQSDCRFTVIWSATFTFMLKTTRISLGVIFKHIDCLLPTPLFQWQTRDCVNGPSLSLEWIKFSFIFLMLVTKICCT